MSSESVSHMVFFIAAVVIATSVSAILYTAAYKVSLGIEEQGESFKKLLGTDFEIINDPTQIPYNADQGYYEFYIKNTGTEEIVIDPSVTTVLIDGSIVDFDSSDYSLKTAEVATLYVYAYPLDSGDHKLIVILENGISRSFEFQV